MGNSHSFSSEYIFYKKDFIERERFRNQWGNLTLLENKFSSTHKCVEKILRFGTDEVYRSYMKSLRSFFNFKNPNLARVLTFSETQEGMCASPDPSVALIVEFPSTSLQDIILREAGPSQKSLHFLEQEDFLNIFYTLTDLFQSLYLFDLPLGEINPLNIFINNKGELCYVNSFILTGNKGSLESFEQKQKFQTTFAPEELLILKFKTQESIVEYDMQQKAVFSFGITLLALLSSQDFRTFYNYEDQIIKFDKITKILNHLETQGYNLELDQILIEMLSREPMERPSFSSIKHRIEQLKLNGNKRLSTRFLSRNSAFDDRDDKWVDPQWSLQELQAFLDRLVKRPTQPRNREFRAFDGVIAEVGLFEKQRECSLFALPKQELSESLTKLFSTYIKKLNCEIRRKYFLSDLEKHVFKPNAFAKIFQRIRELDAGKEVDTKISFKEWKRLKLQVFPQVNLTEKLCEYLYNSLTSAEHIEYQIKDQILAFHSHCSRFHKAEILNNKPDEIKALFQNDPECQIGELRVADILSSGNLGTQTPFRKRTPIEAVAFIKNVDIRALAILIKLLELKYFYIQELSELQAKEVLDQAQLDLDLSFYKKNIFIIDKYLKNAILKLRIRDTQEFCYLKRS